MCVGVGGGGGEVPVAEILAMASYARTGSSVPTREFYTSLDIYKKAQTNLGYSTHPIGRTRSMQMIIPSYSGADRTTQAKVPTWDVCRVTQWYASVITSFETFDMALGGICLPYCLEYVW